MKTKATAHLLSQEDIEEGKKIATLFEELSVTGKIMANVYISALRDKEQADDKKAG